MYEAPLIRAYPLIKDFDKHIERVSRLSQNPTTWTNANDLLSSLGIATFNTAGGIDTISDTNFSNPDVTDLMSAGDYNTFLHVLMGLRNSKVLEVINDDRYGYSTASQQCDSLLKVFSNKNTDLQKHMVGGKNWFNKKKGDAVSVFFKDAQKKVMNVKNNIVPFCVNKLSDISAGGLEVGLGNLQSKELQALLNTSTPYNEPVLDDGEESDFDSYYKKKNKSNMPASTENKKNKKESGASGIDFSELLDDDGEESDFDW